MANGNKIGTRARETIDPGFGVKFKRKTERIINEDGTMNVKRRGIGIQGRNIYQDLIQMRAFYFICVTIGSIFFINIVFALLYMMVGIEQLVGYNAGQGFLHFFGQAFYFSFQTFTTVGYGHISPIGGIASFIASVEAMLGFITFAIVTGLIYGRFSKPNVSLEYSRNVLIAPYKDGQGLMFRIANRRQSMLINVKTNVILTISDDMNGETRRRYYGLDLERDEVLFFPLSWTIVHPLDEKSPFYGIPLEEIPKKELEIMILIEGFDETFGQLVHSRNSYVGKDIFVGGKFKKPFHTDDSGDIILNMEEIHEFDEVKM